MTRDLDLIRKLLIFFDEKSGPEVVEVPPLNGYDNEIIKYHLRLLYDAGLLRCEPVTSSTSDRVIYVLPFELTWKGHEFLAKAQNEFIWDSVTRDIKNRGFKTASFDLLKRLLDKEARKRLDLE